MRFHFLLLLSVFFNTSVYAQNKVSLPSSFEKPIKDEVKLFFSASEGQFEEILKGDVISNSKVTSAEDKQQQIILFVTGIHPRNCHRAMRKLSLYEGYKTYMDFIKESTYDDKNGRVFFIMDHPLIPFAMHLTFKIPRIYAPGHYPFTFEHGFLKDLQGTIFVKDIGKFCLLGLKADWTGKETSIPNLPFEIFLQTVSKIALEHLIRVSLF